MRQMERWALVGVVVALLSLQPASVVLVQAGTMPGQVVQIAGLDDMAATTDAQMKGGAGRTLSYLLLGGGFLSLITTNMLPALMMGAGSLGLAFVPRTISGVFDGAQGATDLRQLLEPTFTSAWWTPLSAPVLYVLMVGTRLLRDPSFLATLAVGMLLVLAIHRQRVWERS